MHAPVQHSIRPDHLSGITSVFCRQNLGKAKFFYEKALNCAHSAYLNIITYYVRRDPVRSTPIKNQ